jgi:glutamine synthetase
VRGVKKLPLNLLDALRALEESEVARDGLGGEFVASYIRMRQQDWDSYSRHLTQWERDTTLDC